MKISALEEYGLRCLLALAKEGTGKQLSISEIAEREGLSVPYASKLLAILRKAELVKAVRGRSGGFALSRNPEQISLYDALSSLGGPLVEPYHCKRFSGQLSECVHVENCSFQGILGGLADHIREYLSNTSIEDLTRLEDTNESCQSREIMNIEDI